MHARGRLTRVHLHAFRESGGEKVGALKSVGQTAYERGPRIFGQFPSQRAASRGGGGRSGPPRLQVVLERRHVECDQNRSHRPCELALGGGLHQGGPENSESGKRQGGGGGRRKKTAGPPAGAPPRDPSHVPPRAAQAANIARKPAAAARSHHSSGTDQFTGRNRKAHCRKNSASEVCSGRECQTALTPVRSAYPPIPPSAHQR